MLNIIIIGIVVVMVLGLYALFALWGCFEEENNTDHQNKKGGGKG